MMIFFFTSSFKADNLIKYPTLTVGYYSKFNPVHTLWKPK